MFSIVTKQTAKKVYGGVAGILFLVMLLMMSACVAFSPPDIEATIPQPSLPKATEPSENEKNQGIFRGLPGSRDERMTVGVIDPDGMNLNPFASGEGLFPVDPSGHCQPVYQSLIKFVPDNLEYVPALAKNFIRADSYITLTLDQKRQWHDGFFITAQDIIFSINAHMELETETGLIFRELMTEITSDGDQTLQIHFADTLFNADNRLLDALSRTLIVPRHRWESLLAQYTTTNQLDATNLPLVGSGPWRLIQQDEFALSFARFEKEDSSPQSPEYLSILLFKKPHLMRHAFDRGELDLVLCASFCDDDIVAHNLLGGSQLLGIAVNPSANELLSLRPFRQLLGLSSDIASTTAILMPHNPPISPLGLLTVPEVTASLNLTGLSEEWLLPDDSAMEALLLEAGLTMDTTSGLLKRGQAPLKRLELLYPENSQRIEQACEMFRQNARERGIDMSLKSVSVDDWQRRIKEGDYELIYQESSLNETPARLSERLLHAPQMDEEANRLLLELGAAKHQQEMIHTMESLSSWMIREQIFIPLAGGQKEMGSWQGTRFQVEDLLLVLSSDAHFLK